MESKCVTCGGEFLARNKLQRFCSAVCRNTIVCQACGVKSSVTDSRAKFCSRSCAATLNNTIHPKRASTPRPCEGCGGEFKSDSRRRFCSRVCAARSRTSGLIGPWLRGESTGSDASGVLASWARSWLLDRAGHACEECGWDSPNQILGRPILTIDHIDGHWRNNSVDNLKVLCYNCHTLTPTFGSLNRLADGGRPTGLRFAA